MSIYLGVGGVARRMNVGHVGIGGVARRIKQVYVGVNGVARPAWADSPKIALGTNYNSTGKIHYSSDGKTFEQVNSNVTSYMRGLTYADGKFYASMGSYLYYSSDGIAWTQVSMKSTTYQMSYSSNGNYAVPVSGYGIYYSPNGTEWTQSNVESSTNSTMCCVCDDCNSLLYNSYTSYGYQVQCFNCSGSGGTRCGGDFMYIGEGASGTKSCSCGYLSKAFTSYGYKCYSCTATQIVVTTPSGGTCPKCKEVINAGYETFGGVHYIVACPFCNGTGYQYASTYTYYIYLYNALTNGTKLHSGSTGTGSYHDAIYSDGFFYVLNTVYIHKINSSTGAATVLGPAIGTIKSICASKDALVAVTSEGKIYVSSDKSSTFKLTATVSNLGSEGKIAFYNDKFYLISSNGYYYTSDDAIEWTLQATLTSGLSYIAVGK